MSRRLIVAVAVALLGLVPGLASPARAQELAPHQVDFTLAAATAAATALPPPMTALDRSNFSAPAFHSTQPAATSVLYTLYGTTALMQALDLRSTLTAFKAGAVEGNPLMSGVTKNRGVFIATKAAIAASTILSAHQMAKHNRVAAILTLAAINSAYAMVVSHNFQLARSLAH